MKACEDAWDMQGRPRRVGIVWFLWFGVVAHLVGGCASSARVRVQADDHYRLAQSYLSNESYVLAEQEIRKALTLQPDDARYLECLAWVHQAQVYQTQGTLNLTRLQLAEEAYRLALRQADAPPSVLVNYSTVLLTVRCSCCVGARTRRSRWHSVLCRSPGMTNQRGCIPTWGLPI